MDERRNTSLVFPASLAGVLGYKGYNLLSDRKVSNPYTSFDQLLKTFEAAKPGDVLVLQDTFMPGKSHPIIITGNKYYDWPYPGDWENKGWREVAAKSKKAPMSPNRVWRGYGRYVEVMPKTHGIVEAGSLESKLRDMVMVKKRKFDPNLNKYVWYEEFSPKHVRYVGSVYRDPNVNPALIEAVDKMVRENADKKLYKYSPFVVNFNLNKGQCGSGTCVTFADSFLRLLGGRKGQVKAILPSEITEGLNEVIKNPYPAKIPMSTVTPALFVLGSGLALKGKKENDKQLMKRGLITAGIGLGLSANKKVRELLNLAGGWASQSAGGMILESGAKALDKIKGIDIKSDQSSYKAIREFMNRNRKVSRGLGAAVLGVPTLYGLYKILDKKNERASL